MTRYIIRRLLGMVLLLILVSGVTFVVFNVFPSTDPAALRAGRQPTPQIIDRIREDLGLDRPLIVQFGDYIWNVFAHQDFGHSYVNNTDVLDQIMQDLPATISLTIGGVLVWLTFGISVGIISAVKHRSVLDRTAIGLSLIAISAPAYWLGLVALYLFAPDFGVFGLGFLGGQGAYTPISEDPLKWLQALVLPWCVLATAFAAGYARLLRGSLLDVFGEDYMRTARAKGLSERRVILRHGVRSAITPVVTVLGLDIGVLLGGAILTESVFNIPGIGRLAYDAITRGDLPVVQGTVLFGAFFIVLMNLIVDVLYAFLDPRVRF
jgi:peptide/nickel transport system permease protein